MKTPGRPPLFRQAALTSKLLKCRDLPEQQPEDDAGPYHPDSKDDRHQQHSHRPAEIEGPAGAVPRRNKERRVAWILVELAEPPMRSDKRTLGRPAELLSGPRRYTD